MSKVEWVRLSESGDPHLVIHIPGHPYLVIQIPGDPYLVVQML